MLGAPRRVPCLLHEPRAEGLRLQGVDRDARGQAEHRAVGVDNVEAGRPQAGERRAEPRDRARRLDARREPRRSPGNTHAAAERQQRDEALLLPRKLVGDAIPTDPEPTEERDANRRGIPARRRFVRRCTARPVGDPRVAGARVAGRFALAHRNAGERGAQPVEQVVQATPGTGAVVAGLAVPQQLGCPGRDRDVLTLPLQYVLGNATRGHLGEARAVACQRRVGLRDQLGLSGDVLGHACFLGDDTARRTGVASSPPRVSPRSACVRSPTGGS